MQDDHVSTSAYVAFPVDTTGVANTSEVGKKLLELQVQAVIWTTTPWTIPANIAISVHPELEYSVVKVSFKHFVAMYSLWSRVCTTRSRVSVRRKP